MRKTRSGFNINTILALIFAVLTVIVLVTGIQSKKCPKNCTVEVEVQPVDYDVNEYMDDDGIERRDFTVRCIYEYKGKKYPCEAKFKNSSSSTPAFDMYKKKIMIDPNDPSKYFVPGTGGVNFTLLAIFAALTVAFGRNNF
ncbi:MULTISPECIES: hypothetical protein [Ruminococcus]|uniref:Uncharacterized protein n=1 Tax=Ruminococcus albus (strain ATCC 27210 / DSM 20455 / JCM 14654 / NCDO 2250 / 7) TaxID=697329 RepID=E6UBW6_RUMA7|nr:MULTISPECIES: hypothetical protein [Ruminococcus]ADU21517.1 hypothetical protein Rumal_0991 [Ruminococcus albus 7 = DSM 20455]MCR5022327.1 hypothetical protein [Ruminococcus sp.]